MLIFHKLKFGEIVNYRVFLIHSTKDEHLIFMNSHAKFIAWCHCAIKCFDFCPLHLFNIVNPNVTKNIYLCIILVFIIIDSFSTIYEKKTIWYSDHAMCCPPCRYLIFTHNLFKAHFKVIFINNYLIEIVEEISCIFRWAFSSKYKDPSATNGYSHFYSFRWAVGCVELLPFIVFK